LAGENLRFSRGGWIARLLLVLASLGCGSSSGPRADANPESGPAGPFDITIASAPPIELPGTVLWLDANFGIAHAGAEVRAWTDRSGLGLVFEAQMRKEAATAPAVDRLGDHGAVLFGGHARMTLNQAIDEKARAALTIGAQDFLVALVVRRDPGLTTPILFALSPLDFTSPGASLLRLTPTLAFTLAGGPPLESTALLPEGQPTVIVLVSQGPALALRINGLVVATSPFGRLADQRDGAPPLDLPFLVPYVGGWDFGLQGLTGAIGEAVLVVGPTVEGALAPLEAYLAQKYGL
jgi:hypothetical protein